MKVEIRTTENIITSRSVAREMAKEIGFGLVDQTKIATAISELTRNMLLYAGQGLVDIKAIEADNRKGIEIICEDQGPGIDDVQLAMQDGFSTSKGLGMGLPGSKRLMDEFDLQSERGKGVRVTARKWMF